MSIVVKIEECSVFLLDRVERMASIHKIPGKLADNGKTCFSFDGPEGFERSKAFENILARRGAKTSMATFG